MVQAAMVSIVRRYFPAAQGRVWAGAICLVVALGGCADQKLHQAAAFADTAIVFEDSLPAIIDQALAVSVQADSLQRVGARKFLRRPQRGPVLRDADKLLVERAAIFEQVKAHGVLLREYFVAIKTLATTDQATGLSQTMNGVVGRMDKLSAQINGSGFSSAGDTIAKLVDQSVNFTVANIKAGALRRSLDRHGKKVDRSLAVQHAFIAVLRKQMAADLGNVRKPAYRNNVVKPFVDDGNLPNDWWKRRLELLTTSPDLRAVMAAETAARRVRHAFLALAVNELNTATLGSIVSELDSIVGIAETVKTLHNKEAKP